MYSSCWINRRRKDHNAAATHTPHHNNDMLMLLQVWSFCDRFGLSSRSTTDDVYEDLIVIVRPLSHSSSSIFQYISAIYQIEFEFKYLSFSKLSINLSKEDSDKVVWIFQNVLSAFVSSNSQSNSNIIISSFSILFIYTDDDLCIFNIFFFVLYL